MEYNSVNLKSSFGKSKTDRSLKVVILCAYFIHQYRVKDSHKIFQRKEAPFTTYDNFKNWLLNIESLQKIYAVHCKILCLLSYKFNFLLNLDIMLAFYIVLSQLKIKKYVRVHMLSLYYYLKTTL